jgi:predicted DsbA family dithiol-disulfide isomerase
MKAGRLLAGVCRRIDFAARAASAITVAAAAAIAFAVIATLAPHAARAADAGADPVVATIGDHHITQSEMDAAMLQSLSKSQLYDLRKQTLDKMIDTYVVDAAAKKANLPPDVYLARELKSKNPVTAADAQKYYDAHKAGIDQQTGGKPFKDIEPLLISALQRHDDRERRDALIAKLRTDDHVKVALEEPRVNVASAGHPWTGGKDAPVTIVEFSDFQCPYCRSAEPVLKQVRAKYGDKVKLVYMDFPLGMHQHAMDAAVAGRCAAEQNKFWELHDAMFSDQTKLDAAGLKASAAKVGLDMAKFNACLEAKPGANGIKSDQAQGERLGVSGTPTFFVNGRELVGAESEQGFSDVIDDELSHPGAAQTQASAH